MSYFDWNATTPLHPEVAELVARAFREATTQPGNPSSVHQGGRRARARLDAARAQIARLLGAEPKEVCFTASGSEADALALKGAFAARPDKARVKVVISTLEHPAILLAARQLEAEGARVERVGPDATGRIAAERFLEAVGDDAALASLMWANNETGVLQPVREVAAECRRRGTLFHTDAVQATGKVRVTLQECDADLLSVSAHKFGGPAGVGLLLIRRGLNVEAQVPGHQEWGRRGGTQNLPYIEALALALELTQQSLEAEGARQAALRDWLEAELLAGLPGVHVNGGGVPRVPNTSNLRFEGADGEALLIGLDLQGLCVSAGAACASGSVTPSHVLTAMGLSPTQAHESLRISLGRTTTDAEVSALIAALLEQVPRARQAA